MIPSIIAVIMLCSVVLLISGCKKTPETLEMPTTAITVEQVKLFSKAEFAKMLDQIETQDAPLEKMGAMCYKMAAPPRHIEYICPTCGEKTIYTEQTYVISKLLPICRREMEQIKKIPKVDATLDESDYCKKCSPDVKSPTLVLSIKSENGNIHSTPKITPNDLRMLKAFLKGELSYGSDRDTTYPLKKRLERLRQLLGI